MLVCENQNTKSLKHSMTKIINNEFSIFLLAGTKDVDVNVTTIFS